LKTRTVSPSALGRGNVGKLVEDINEAKGKNTIISDVHKKDISDMKTKKVAISILAAVGTILLMIGIGAACVFCPPAGVALIVIGVVGVGCVGAVGIASLAGSKPKLDKEHLQNFEQKEAVLNRALVLLDNEEHGPKFKAFLEKCPSEGLGGPAFNIGHLGDYIKIYEKQDKLNTQNAKITGLEGEVAQFQSALRELGVKPDEVYQTPQEKLQNWQDIKNLEEEVAIAKRPLTALGVADPDSVESIQERIQGLRDTIAQLQTNSLELINENRTLKTENFIANSPRIQVSEEKIQANKGPINANKNQISKIEIAAANLKEKKGALEEAHQIRVPALDAQDVRPSAKETIKQLKDTNFRIMAERGGASQEAVDKKIVNNNAAITKINELAELIFAKQNDIKILVNPNSASIERHENLITTQLNILKTDAGINKPEILPAARAEVKELITERARAKDTMDNLDDTIQKQTATLQFNAANARIVTITKCLNDIDKEQAKIDQLYDSLTPTAAEIELDKNFLRYNINPHNVDLEQDLSKDNHRLGEWQGKSLILRRASEDTPFVGTTEAINIFGTYHKRPQHGIFRQDERGDSFPGYEGNSLRLDENALKTLGRTNTNNFLSNSYEGDIVVNGEKYASVSHYMLIKKVEKDINFLKNPDNKGKLQNGEEDEYQAKGKIKRLEEIILPALRSEEYSNPVAAYEMVMRENQRPSGVQYLDLTGGIYHGMDKELKTALFRKFVGNNGLPTAEGRMLLDTGNKQLNAGYEHGDASYGVEFTKKNENGSVTMEGDNKLGIALMEIRELMRKDKGKPIA